MGVGLLVGVWVARYLGPEQFGLFSFASTFVGMFGAIAGLGLQGIVVRDIVRDPACKEETLGTAALLLFIGGLLAYGLILCAIFWLRPADSMAKTLVAILGSTMLFKASEVAVYWFESQVQSKYIVWVQNSVFLVFAVIKVALILSHAQLIAFAWVTIAEALVVALLIDGMLGRCGLILRELRVTIHRAKSLLRESYPLLLSGIAIMLYMKIDQIMLGQLINNESVGIYSAAVRISEVVYFIPSGIVVSVFPSILEAKKRSIDDYYHGLQNLYDLMVWLSVVVAIPISLVSTVLVTLLFGKEYMASAKILEVHIWSSVFIFLIFSSGKWFIEEGYQLLALKRNLYGLFVNVALNFVLIPEYGGLGAAWSTLISYAYVGLVSDFFQLKTRVKFYMKLRAITFWRPLRFIFFH
jgi:PST family polysaccharide transporter